MPLTTRRNFATNSATLNASLSQFSTPQSAPAILRRRLRPIPGVFENQSGGTDLDTDHGIMDNAVVVESIGASDGDLEPFGDVQMDEGGSGGAQAGKSAEPTTSNHQENQSEAATSKKPLQTFEFSFLDNQNVCCGLCGEIVPYEQLLSDHLPYNHPNVLSSTDATDADASIKEHERRHRQDLKEKLSREKRLIERGFKMSAYQAPVRASRTVSTKNRQEPSRRVSSIRVNPRLMSLAQLEEALQNKMFEKLNRRVPVTLMDKMHARCGLCNAIISLNKKFEIVHLVRHFNCWHPTLHSCAGSWQNKKPTRRDLKLLSTTDFAVVDVGNGTPDSLQCIWCGMFVESHLLAQHFGELHSDDVEVPKCNLCMQEMILTVRFQEKFSLDIQIILPDEHHLKCSACGATFSSDTSLESHIQRRHVAGLLPNEDPDDDDVNLEEIGPEAFSNSRMTLGKRRRPKRQFIMPALRQAVPLDSEFVEPIAECHWKCKICEGDIYGAVISAAAIRHYKFNHPDHVDNMQYEICKSRLEKISDSCMEFVHPQLIECLLCQQTFNLHQPFNMCRAIRHLKAKHQNLMPEYAGLTQADEFEEEDEGATSTVLRRQAIMVTDGTVVYAQQPQADLGDEAAAEGMVYGTHLVQEADDDEDEGEEIIVAAGGGGTIGFDSEAAVAYSQQYATADGNALSAPVTYQATTSDLNAMAIKTGIRVFRTPQQVRYYDQSAYATDMATSMAAKNAHLDHGAISRPPLSMPTLVMDPHRMHIQPNEPPQLTLMDDRMPETNAPVLYHHQQAQPQPRQFFLVLQANLAPAQQSLLDSSLSSVTMAHDGNLNQQQAVINVLDESMLEAQRLADLMSQANSVLASSTENNEHRQQQSLMTGDDSLI